LDFYHNLISELESKLYDLEENPSDIIQRTEQGVKLIKEALHQLMPMVINKKFENPFNEIEFFKIIKPRVFSKLIYYVKRFKIETKRPKGSNKAQIKYLNNHIQ